MFLIFIHQTANIRNFYPLNHVRKPRIFPFCTYTVTSADQANFVHCLGTTKTSSNVEYNNILQYFQIPILTFTYIQSIELAFFCLQPFLFIFFYLHTYIQLSTYICLSIYITESVNFEAPSPVNANTFENKYNVHISFVLMMW